MSQILGPLRSPARASSLATDARSHRGRRLIRYCQGPGPPHCVGARFFCGEGACSRLSAQHSQSLWYVADFGAASQPGASKLARHRRSLPQGAAFDQILPRTWATTLRRSEVFLWRGSLLPLERAALTKSVVCRRFWGRFAARREQARSPQTLAPTGGGV